MLKKIIIFLFTLNVISAIGQENKISSSLQYNLTKTKADEVIRVWIYFTDKGENIDYNAVEKNLTEKSKKRRKKVMDENLVDFYDVPVNNNYIKILKSSVNKIVVKSKWLNAVSAEIFPLNINDLIKYKFVKYVDLVKKYKRKQPYIENENIQSTYNENIYTYDYGNSFTQNSQINVPELHDMGINGSGVLICVLDNNFNLLQHETFSSMNILETWDFINNDSTVNDPGEGTHGTQTLSTVGGWSPGHLIGPAFGADFILGKTEVNSFEQPIEEDYWVEGAEWADSLGADVLSSSLGYIDWYTWQDMDGNTAVTTIGADIAASKGIVVVNSAGNEGSGVNNTLIAPADGDSVIAVAAVTSSGTRSSFSSVGPSADGRTKPDVAAMGSSVTVASTSNPTGYTSSSGTSFSCPLTSGVAALVLSVNPNLTPMQVRDALRETASQAAAPDNELGWGILNAYNAVFYFNSEFTHDPLNDVEDLNGPYEVIATITSRLPLITAETKLVYSTDLSFSNEVVMQPTGNPDEYSAQIIGTGNPDEYNYYLTATNDQQITSVLPFGAPTEYFRFYAGPDTVYPMISHSGLYNQALARWPATVSAIVSDNLGVDSVWVEFRINGGTFQSFNLVGDNEDLFSGQFPVPISNVNAGDIVEYKIYAQDNSNSNNTSQIPVSGYFQFEIIDALGLAIIIDDDLSTESTKDGKNTVIRSKETLGMSANRFEKVLQRLGFIVDSTTSATLDTSTLGQYDLIVSASGAETAPIASLELRTKLEDWVLSNPQNKLIIEGGEVGYDALSFPGYPSFASNVLHGFDWNTDNAGNLVLNSGQSNHPIVTTPNQLPSNISINYTGWGDEDAIQSTTDAYVVYGTNNYPGSGGIIVYDDDADSANAQIAYYAFNINAIDTTIANNLIENTIMYLINEGVATSIADEISKTLPVLFDIQQNYPNPFNPQTTIEFSIPDLAQVEFDVFNLLGQNVYKKQLKDVKAGIHKIKFNGEELSSGLYFYSISAKTVNGKVFNKTRKMLLIQ